MPNLVPVDNDPFASAQPASAEPKLVPVDHDPFKAPDPGFIERSGADVKNRLGEMSKEGDRAFSDSKKMEGVPFATEARIGEAGFQQAGEVVGMGGDIAGEAISSAVKPYWEAVPQSAKDKIHDVVKKVGDSPMGQAAIKALQKGGQTWDNFSKEHPDAAKNLESGFNLATAELPIGKAAVKNAVSSAGTGILSKVGDAAITAGKSQKAADTGKFFQDLVSPEKTKSVRLDEVGRTSEKGILKNKTVDPTTREKDLAAEVSNVPGVSNKNTVQGNFNVIKEHNQKEAESLISKVKANNVAISPQEFQQVENTVKKNLSGKAFLSSAESKEFANKALAQMGQFIQKNGSTAAGVLQARKDFDNWVRTQAPKFFDANYENMKTEVVREIRTAANNLVESKVPGVKDSLAKQNKLYDVLDNMRPKAEKEANNAIMRTIQRVEDYSPVSVKSEFGKSSSVRDIVKGGLATAATGVKAAHQALTGPSLKIGAGHALKMIDGVLKTAKDPQLVKELRADRLVLLGAMKDIGDSVPEQPATAEQALNGQGSPTDSLQSLDSALRAINYK